MRFHDHHSRATLSKMLLLEMVVRWACLSAAVVVPESAAPTPSPPPPASSLSTPTLITAPPVRTNHVSIIDYAFLPQAILVPVNTIVTWTNDVNFFGDLEVTHHTSTSDEGQADAWDSGLIRPHGLPGDTYSRNFTVVGNFTYHCNIHVGMRGLVVVAPANDTDTDSDSERV